MSEVVTVFRNEDFHTEIEVKEGKLFLHTEVENFDKSVLKTMREVFNKISEEIWIWGWDHFYSYTQNVKFCEKMGECEVVTQVNVEGEVYEVVAWESKPQSSLV